MKILPIKDKDSVINSVFIFKGTPHCKTHGAMLKVSIHKDGGGIWRCCTCDGVICRSGCIEVRDKFKQLWRKIKKLF